mgnify:CR=1 FL=1
MKKRNVYIWAMRVLMWLAAAITAALTLFLLGYVLIKGIPNISWELLSTKPSYLRGTVGILPDILNTLYIILTTLLFVLPLGVGAAIYLTEYATNKKLVGMIEYAAETLSGIPSIIYGLFGSLFFCQFMDLDKSLLAGALTGMKAAAIGLIGWSAYQLGQKILHGVFSWILALVSLGAVAFLGIDAIWIILLGIASGILYSRRKKEDEKAGDKI